MAGVAAFLYLRSDVEIHFLCVDKKLSNLHISDSNVPVWLLLNTCVSDNRPGIKTGDRSFRTANSTSFSVFRIADRLESFGTPAKKSP